MNEFIPNFRDRQVSSALRNLCIFSATIIGVPLFSMFFSKRYLFEGILHYSPQDSITYAAIVAVVLVHVVLVAFVYTAWKEPTEQMPTGTDKKRD